jgi:hypothetical protein
MIHIPAYVIAIMPNKTRRLFINEKVAAQCGARVITESPSSTIFETKAELREALKLEARRNTIEAFMKTVGHSKDRRRIVTVLSYTPEEFSTYLTAKGIKVGTAGTLKNLMVTKGYFTFFDFLERISSQKLASMIGYGDTYIHTIQQVIEEEKIPWELIFKKRKPRKMSNEKIKALLKKPIADLIELGLDHRICLRMQRTTGAKNLREFITSKQDYENKGEEIHSFGKKALLELENFLEDRGIPRDIDLNKYFSE